jgi:hypothetical protein
MKLATSNATPAVHNLSSPSHFSIKKENMSHIIGILRSKIYSNKWLAVLREYLTNAVDAHVEAGIGDTPVELTLPTLSSPKLTIRDYGKGLSEEDVREMYIMYGSSTKRNSNEYTGCLGIGCKAAFAYTDTFTVTSYHQGTRSIYNAVIDDDSEGSIFCLSQYDTEEPDGIEIIVPVQTGDLDNFKDEAWKLLPYFNVIPKLTNTEYGHIPTFDIAKSGERWRLKQSDSDISRHSYHRNHGKATAVMGNIPYKLDSEKMGTQGEHLDIINCAQLIINFPMGSLDIAANRESLEYTTRTITNISIEAKRVLNDIAIELQYQIELEHSLWEASIVAMDITDNLPSGIGSTVFNNMEYSNQKLKRTFQFPCNIVKHYRKHRYRANDYQNSKDDVNHINTERHTTICSYDKQELSPTQATLRIRTLQAKDNWNKEKIYYAVAYDSKGKVPKGTSILDSNTLPVKFLKKLPKPSQRPDGSTATWKSDAHLLKDNYLDLHNIEAYKPVRVKKNADGTDTSVKIDTCHLAPSHLASGRIIKSEQLVPCDGNHIYIPLDRYSWHKKAYCLDHDEFQLIEKGMHMLHQALGLPKLVIHGVKKHYLANLDDTWVELDVWYNKLYQKLKNKYRKIFTLAANHQHRHNGHYDHAEHEVFKQIPKNLRFPAWEAFRTIREQYDYTRSTSQPHWTTVRDDATVDAKDNEDVSALIHHVWLRFNRDYTWPTTIIEAHGEFIKTHPMMKYFASNWNSKTKEEANDVKEYLTRA